MQSVAPGDEVCAIEHALSLNETSVAPSEKVRARRSPGLRGEQTAQLALREGSVRPLNDGAELPGPLVFFASTTVQGFWKRPLARYSLDQKYQSHEIRQNVPVALFA